MFHDLLVELLSSNVILVHFLVGNIEFGYNNHHLHKSVIVAAPTLRWTCYSELHFKQRVVFRIRYAHGDLNEW